MSLVIDRERHVAFAAEVEPETVLDLIANIDDLARNSPDPIYVTICTKGGDVEAALWFADYISTIPNWVVGIAAGSCQSAGVVMLSACDERWSYKNTIFLCHPSSISAVGVSSSIQMQALAESYRITELLTSDVQRQAFSGLQDDEFEEFMQRDTFFTAEQAQDLGLVEKIIETCKKERP